MPLAFYLREFHPLVVSFTLVSFTLIGHSPNSTPLDSLLQTRPPAPQSGRQSCGLRDYPVILSYINILPLQLFQDRCFYIDVPLATVAIFRDDLVDKASFGT